MLYKDKRAAQPILQYNCLIKKRKGCYAAMSVWVIVFLLPFDFNKTKLSTIR